MKHIISFLNSGLLAGLLVALLLTAPLQSCASNTVSSTDMTVENPQIDNLEIEDSIQTDQTNTPKKSKKKRKVKEKPMNNKLVEVPTGIWGANGIILNVEKSSAAIQYECADGIIEQPIKVDEKGNFEVTGFHIPQRGGPIRVDAKQVRQPALFEGKITGDKMTFKVTLTESKEVIGDFILEHGKTPRLQRCY